MKFKLLLFFFLFAAYLCNAQTIRYVNVKATGANNGSTWTDAYTKLETAINEANTGTGQYEIRVAQSNMYSWYYNDYYYPSNLQGTTDSANNTFAIKRAGIKLYGGYNPQSGNRVGNSLITEPPTNRHAFGTVFHLMVLANIPNSTTDSVIIDGFQFSGGGILNSNNKSTLNINGVPIAKNAGGAIYCRGISANTAFRNCVFFNNNAATGGGIYMYGSGPIIQNCLFKFNSAHPIDLTSDKKNYIYAGNGDAIACTNFSNPKIYNSIFALQSFAVEQSNIYNSGSMPIIANCNFLYNPITNYGLANATITNSILLNIKNINGGTATVSNSYTDYPGTGNISNGYIYFDPTGQEESDLGFIPYGVLPGSVNINAGNNAAVAGIATDYTGKPRIKQGTVDIGALESEFPVGMYVNAAVASSGSGDTWGTAYKTLGEALSYANAHTDTRFEIRVAAGTYYPTGSSTGTDRNASFNIVRNNFSIVGGYNPATGNRDPAANPTILSGDIGVAGNDNDNSYHVLTLAAVPSSRVKIDVLIEGFTIINGNANGSGSVVVNGQTIERNSGGGIYATSVSSNVLITNCIIAGNKAVNGAGIYSLYAENPFSNIVLANNVATAKGGAVYHSSSYLQFTNATLSTNSAAISGGGIYNEAQSLFTGYAPVIANSIIWGNTAPSGAGVHNNNSNSTTTATYSLVQNGYAGKGNINEDPLFINPADVDGADNILGTADDGLKLTECSRAINAGSDSASNAIGIRKDITGIERIMNGKPDMGAYETDRTNAPPNTIYVNAAITTTGDGKSWATAYKTLNEAIDKSNICPQVDTIKVAAGTYYPTGVQSSTKRDTSFIFTKAGLEVLGGYNAATGERNIKTNITTLSGDIGVQGDNTDNSNFIVSIRDVPQSDIDSLILDGFTISGVQPASTTDAGYAINIFSSSNSVISNCIIENNKSVGIGTILWNGILSNCIIRNNINNLPLNTVFGGSGGISLLLSHPTISNCVFANNNAQGNGGAIANIESNPTITNCVFANNSTQASGGAISNDYDIFFGNGSGSKPKIINCTFSANTAQSGNGGAIRNVNNSSALIYNSIIWGNTATTDGGIYNDAQSASTVGYSIVQGSSVYPGINNSFADPLFSNAADADGADNIWGTNDDGLQTTIGSPAINTGKNDSLPLNSVNDITGAKRIKQHVVDMGAYESDLTTSYYVNAAVPFTGNGSSWNQAFKTLEEALSNANVFNNRFNIYIAGGTYYPAKVHNTSDSATGARDAAFAILHGGIRLYGSYNPVTNVQDTTLTPTILSGDKGVINNNDDNSFHVMIISDGVENAADSIIINSIKFVSGNARTNGMIPPTVSVYGETFSRNNGGALYLNDLVANTIIQNCSFSNNHKTSESSFMGPNDAKGGALYIRNSSPIISSCNFYNNSSDKGGAIGNESNSNPEINNSNFANNNTTIPSDPNLTAWGYGGAIYNTGSSPTINYCKFIENISQNGGAICDEGLSMPNITSVFKSIFMNNKALTGYGGAFNSQNSDCSVSNSIFANNESGYGGAIHAGSGAASFTQCIITKNTATGFGGGMALQGGNTKILNSTIQGNTADSGAAIHNYYAATPNITNSILWGNTSISNDKSITIDFITSPISITNSIVQPQTVSHYTGSNNVNTDPLFSNAADADGADNIWGTNDDGLKLQECSPAINTGINDSLSYDINLDFAGMQRIQRITVDIGAYETNSISTANATMETVNASAGAYQLANNITYYGSNCTSLIAAVTGDGTVSAINGYTAAKVWIETTQPVSWVKRHYEIAPDENATTATGKVTLYFTQADFDAFNNQIPAPALLLPANPLDILGIANIKIEKRSGTSMDGTGLPGSYSTSIETIDPIDTDIVWNATANRWEINFNVTGFSGFFMKTQAATLPLKLLSFTGTRKDGVNNLVWKTASESNLTNYEVQRSANAQEFTTITTVKANNGTAQSYTYDDKIEFTGKLYYRIKINESDGKVSYSKIVTLTDKDQQSTISIYPNPAKTTVTIKLSDEKLKNTEAKLYDVQGKLIMTSIIKSTNHQVNISSHQPGIYFLKFANGETHKLIKE